MYKSNTTFLKRKIISVNECKHDLRNYLKDLFVSVNKGIENYNKIISLISFEARVRNCEAVNLNAMIVDAIQKSFPGKWTYAKYKRFLLRVEGYNVFFKKLDKYGYPMNVKTKNVVEIANQQQGSLFNTSVEFSDTIEPNVFFGYKKDKWGNIVDLQLLFIDEGVVKWRIKEADILDNENYVGSATVSSVENESLVKIRKSAETEITKIV